MKKTKNFLYLFGGFLVCVLLLVFLLYQFTTGKLNDAMETAGEKQLSYATEQLDEKSQEVEMLASSIVSDQNVRFFYEKMVDPEFDNYEYVTTIRLIREKLQLALINAGGVDDILLYWPETDTLIAATSFDRNSKLSFFKQNLDKGRKWIYQDDIFYFSASYPYVGNQNEPQFYIFIETQRNFLNDIRRSATNIDGARGIAALADKQVLYPDEKSETDEKILEKISTEKSREHVTVNGKNYTLLIESAVDNQVRIISYFENKIFMQPVAYITIFTFASIVILVSIGLLLMYLFYKNVLFQMKILVTNFRKVENGDLTVKIQTEASNEFNYVFTQFNQMTTGIRHLLSSFNNEYTRRNIAERKHLQAQINPHFLYNSLFYIISVAEDSGAVRQMTSLLAEYYQYRTNSKSFVTVEEEVRFSETFLGIMALRKSFDYEIHVEEDGTVMDEVILPLLIQPLLENAVKHGIEESDDAHQIILDIYEKAGKVTVTVEDDGPGMSETGIDTLMNQIAKRENQNENSHVGLWNVNQRLVNYYGRKASLIIQQSESLGGLKISFTIEGEKSREITDC